MLNASHEKRGGVAAAPGGQWFLPAFSAGCLRCRRRCKARIGPPRRTIFGRYLGAWRTLSLGISGWPAASSPLTPIRPPPGSQSGLPFRDLAQTGGPLLRSLARRPPAARSDVPERPARGRPVQSNAVLFSRQRWTGISNPCPRGQLEKPGKGGPQIPRLSTIPVLKTRHNLGRRR